MLIFSVTFYKEGLCNLSLPNLPTQPRATL